jgi:hypothetical protein
MSLKPGDVLEKKRGGGTRKARVLRVGRLSAILEDVAPTNQKRTSAVKTHAVNLGEDGMPEGYRRAVKP